MVAEAVIGAPDVEHLHTPAIDDRSIIRGFARSADVRDRSVEGRALRTVDVLRIGYVPSESRTTTALERWPRAYPPPGVGDRAKFGRP